MIRITQDFRESIRGLTRAPGLTASVVLSVGIGIGANTAVFSFVNAVQFKSLPVQDEDTLVDVSETSTTELCEGCAVGTSFPAFEDWKARAVSFDALAGYREGRYVVSGGTGPVRVGGAVVSAGLFRLIGVQPSSGRGFAESDDRRGAEPVAIISDGLWRRRFGAEPGILGASLKVDGVQRTIIGIMPPRFAFPEYAELWLPLASAVNDWPRKDRSLGVIGRLRRGVTMQDASVEMRAIGASLAAQHAEHRQWQTQVVSLREDMTGETKIASIVLMCAVAFVLLIACANVANLLMVRAANRRRELAIRSALGASRGRMAQLIIIETLLLAICGGACGLVLAIWGAGAIAGALGEAAPYWIQFGIDGRVVLFGIAMTIVSGVVCALAPAIQVARPDFHSVMKGGDLAGAHLTGRRLRNVLAAGQLALALLLLAGAGLMIKTVIRVYNFEVGYDPTRVLVADVELADPRYADRGQVLAFSRDVIERLARIDGVRAAVSRTVFFAGFGATPRQISVEGMSSVPAEASPGFYHAVTPGYFSAFGIPITQGRAFTPSDATGVVILNEEMARRLWPDATAIGRRIRLGDEQSTATWLTVVGVVANAGGTPYGGRRAVYAYVPLAAEPGTSLSVTVGSDRDAAALVKELHAAVAAVDPDQPVEDAMTMEAALARWMQPARFMGLLMSSLAGVAVLMAVMGTFSVIAFAVSGRTREIGIRLAIGATPRQVQQLMARSGAYLVLSGLLVGIPAAAVCTRALEGVLSGTSPTDPVVFATVSALLAIVAFVASWLPARRAARIDPLIVLRSE